MTDPITTPEQMREAAALIAYRVCAETRHVTLGQKVHDAIRAIPIALQPVAVTVEGQLFVDKDGDVCINDGRYLNLVFCPAAGDDGKPLCPDVVAEIVSRFNAPQTDTIPEQMREAAALLPCPFCGGEASAAGYQKWSHPIPDMTWDGGYPITEAYFCNCMKCGISNIISGVGHRTEVEAIAAWNRRAKGGSHD